MNRLKKIFIRKLTKPFTVNIRMNIKYPLFTIIEFHFNTIIR